MILSPEKLVEFRSLIDTSAGPDACHPWLGSFLSSGYGRFRVTPGQERVRAHRLALVLATDVPLDYPLVARHDCDNPPCCNEKHLQWGEQRDNVQDMVQRGRATNGGKTWTLRLTDEELLRIINAIDSGQSPQLVAEEFGVAWSYARAIKNGYSKRAAQLRGGQNHHSLG